MKDVRTVYTTSKEFATRIYNRVIEANLKSAEKRKHHDARTQEENKHHGDIGARKRKK